MSQQLLPLVAAENLEPWTLRPEMAAAADLRTACANLQNNSEDGMHSGMRQNAVSTAKSSLWHSWMLAPTALIYAHVQAQSCVVPVGLAY